MNKRILFLFLIIPLSLIAIYSCIDFDYFSKYKDKNLISHTALSDWSPSQSNTYMIYEPVTAADAGGTAGLPDASALIYRLENLNLFPNGDFEASTAGSIPAGWSGNGGTVTVQENPAPPAAPLHPLNGKAMYFDLGTGRHITFSLLSLLDGAPIDDSYVIRYNISSTKIGNINFTIENGADTRTIDPLISAIDTAYKVPEDFDKISPIEFTIDGGSDSFSIKNSKGYIDDIRVVKLKQIQEIYIEVPFNDTNRVDSLELMSGWYRFSIYVKADPSGGTANRFKAETVTLFAETLNTNIGNSSLLCFAADEYSSFNNWTKIYIDINIQIEKPSVQTENVIKLSIRPYCTKGGAITADSGSILVSNPSLEFSAEGF